MVLRNVRIVGNDAAGEGGAIWVDANATDALVIENSVISANTAATGAGIALRAGGAQLTNVTLSANRSVESGGAAIVAGGNASLVHVTLAGNSAGSGGGLMLAGGTLTITNSLLADNVASSGADCLAQGGTLISGGGNLVAQPADCAGWNATTDRLGVAPGIAELRDNGGDTRTYALLPGSAARDGALSAACPATDQRGELRNTDGVGNGQPGCDIGAFEAAAVPFQEFIFGDSFE